MALDPVRESLHRRSGQEPAVLSGRDIELQDFTARLRRLETGRSAQRTLIVGLRGVGKTVLLNRFSREAWIREWIVVDHELTAWGDFFATVARLARDALHEIAPPSRWRRAGHRVAAILASIETTYQIAGLAITSPATRADDAVGVNVSGDQGDFGGCGSACGVG